MALNPKQQAFVDAYAGDGVDAARKAGYSGTPQVLAITASKLLRVPKVRDAVEARRAKKANAAIATREERQSFWTSVMRDADGSMFDRLKASELLGKSEADFIERQELSAPSGISISITGVRK